MDNLQPSQTTLETLRTVEFRLGLKGYNVDEVDEYLEKAAVEAESLMEQTRQMSERLREATERIAELEVARQQAPPPEDRADAGAISDDSLQRTLLMAQRFVDQTKRETEAEAAEVISQAEERARSLISQAEEKARQLGSDADRRLRDEVVKLEGMRGQLAADVENMARHLETERNRLQASLSEMQKWVEENVQPARSLMALKDRQEPTAGGASRSDERTTGQGQLVTADVPEGQAPPGSAEQG